MDKEEQLKQRIARSDKTAFAVAFRAYYSKVYKFILSIVKEECSAEDLAQEDLSNYGLKEKHSLPFSLWIIICL